MYPTRLAPAVNRGADARPPRFLAHAVRGIVFDLDGTLVDSYAAIAESLNHARGAFGLPPLTTDEVRVRVGHGLEALIAELCGPERVARGVELFRERYAEVFGPLTQALPGVARTLAELRGRGYRLALASNKPARFSEPLLAGLALRAYFECVLGPDSVGSAKPEPAMLWRCLAQLGVAAHQAVYVGDMTLDVETARRADVAVVLVASGSSARRELEATGCTVLSAVGELCALLPREAPQG